MGVVCFIDKSISLALKLFPSTYQNAADWGRKVFHFTFVYKRNKLISIGYNNTQKINNKSLKFANRFGIEHWKEYPYVHSELDAISRMWGRTYIDSSMKFVCLRLNKYGKFNNSKPCRNCTTVLNALNINKVYWSDSEGNIKFGI